MSTKLKIKVTKDILERSKMCSHKSKNGVGSSCAIALATRDVFPSAHVTMYAIFVKGIDKNLSPVDGLIIGLPKEARNFIERFDGLSPASRPSLPELEFEIDIPDVVLEQINIDELRPLLKNHPTLELV